MVELRLTKRENAYKTNRSIIAFTLQYDLYAACLAIDRKKKLTDTLLCGLSLDCASVKMTTISGTDALLPLLDEKVWNPIWLKRLDSLFLPPLPKETSASWSSKYFASLVFPNLHKGFWERLNWTAAICKKKSFAVLTGVWSNHSACV